VRVLECDEMGDIPLVTYVFMNRQKLSSLQDLFSGQFTAALMPRMCPHPRGVRQGSLITALH